MKIEELEKDENLQQIARDMAEAVNGGSWDKDYVRDQKRGWILKAKWAVDNAYHLVDVKEGHV